MCTTSSLVTSSSENPLPDYQVYENIKAANKHKSGVPVDLPGKLVKEFIPELSCPICEIFNSIRKSAKHGIVASALETRIWNTPEESSGPPLR